MNRKFGKIQTAARGVMIDKRQGKLWNVRKYTANGNPIITMLRREPNNPRDPHAIAILVKTDKTVAKIGYVPANIAFWLSKRMDSGLIVRAIDGKVTGGRKVKNLGFKFTVMHEIA